MRAIVCGTCVTGTGMLRVLPDRTFECPSGHQLTLQDVDLDGGHVWAVDASGALGYVVHPALSLEVIAEAIDDLAASGGCPDPAYAARAALDKALGAASISWQPAAPESSPDG
ncbi:MULTISPECIES: hypothetical protein [unclassified Streptomyces]|uniref:hypothetical protein n=1 Tax=unclassified Streptomyces TaxID=2593676 RepID=UPI002E80E7DE|nr:hypothetical protein [Streptomyces sp. NBC_00569]WUB90846.1 hypothetical protein OHO83_00005 [Streptomyces sp. NBC_00569]WUB99193.1 hypothetical protein OHO83_46885 [Streptomyces sp. NBC_00569]